MDEAQTTADLGDLASRALLARVLKLIDHPQLRNVALRFGGRKQPGPMRSPPEHGPLHLLLAFEADLGAERDPLVRVLGTGLTRLVRHRGPARWSFHSANNECYAWSVSQPASDEGDGTVPLRLRVPS